MVPAFKKCILFYCVAASIIPYGLDAWGRPKQKISRESRYKINFKQVKAEEFLQFLSEIAGLNFVYNPSDLNFFINLVSDEEMTIETIVSGFVQTLRIQGFNLLEENGTLIIHRSQDIKEMPMLLNSETVKGESVPPIVTKIYQVKNSPVEVISSLIQPFLSTTSVIEVFNERRLLIISDVVQNILSIDSLVKAIDQPETGAVNIIYDSQYFQPSELVSIASPILDTLCGGKSYSLLPQDATQRVYIVGSSELADKALEVFQQIEEKASKQQISITTGNILLYRAQNRSIQSIAIALRTIAKDSKRSDYNSSSFSKMVDEANLIAPDMLLFIGEPVQISKISNLIKTIDTPQQVKSDLTFSIIKLQHASGKTVLENIRSMGKDIPEDDANEDFILALETLRWNKDTNSIVVQGSPHVIEEITSLINKIDKPVGSTADFSIIKLQNVSGKFVLDQLNQMTSQLTDSSENMPFITAVRDLQWNKLNNTITVRGNPQIIQQLTDIITKLDIHTVSSTQYIIYKPTTMTAPELQKILQGIAHDLENAGTADPSLIQSVKGIKVIKNSNSIIVSGSEANIGKIREMITSVDSHTQTPAKNGFSIIKLQNVSGKYVLDQLKQMASQLPDSTENMPFIQAANDVQWNKDNNTLTIQGNPQIIQQLTDIITKLDIHTVSSTQYIIYKPTTMTAPELQKILQGIAHDLENAGTADPSLIQSVKGIKVIKNSNSIIVSGSEANIGKIREMITSVDSHTQTPAKTGFSIIKLQNVSGKYVLDQLKQMASQLPDSTENMPFIQAANDVQWNKDNNTLTIQGNPQIIQQLTDIITKLDIHTASSTQYIIYTPTTMTALELQKILQGIAHDLENAGTADPSLIQSVKGIKVIKNSNSIIVSGSEANIGKIREMITSVDSHSKAPAKTGFSIIKLQNVSGKYVLDQLKQMASQLPDSTENMPFIQAVNDVQWNKDNNTLTIQGNPQIIQQLTDIITKLDIHTVSSTQYIIYKPTSMTAPELQKILQGIAHDLENAGTADPSLIQSIKGIKVIKNSNSIIVSGSEANIPKIREMITSVDSHSKTPAKTGFSIIKLQNVSGKYVLDQLNQMASQLPDSTENMPFIQAVNDVQWNKANNTLTIQGNPEIIQQLTDIITKLDIHTVSSTQYIIYKPTNMTAQELQKILQGIANDLENAGTADPSLLQTIKGIKVIKNSNSIIVSGSEANIAKIREMITAVDSLTQSPSKISQVGTATFLSYVPKSKTAKELLAQLKSTTKDIREEDPELVKTIDQAKISEGTIVFSGSAENLEKIEKLLDSFDQKFPGSTTKQEADNYQNYKPVYKTGPDLIKEVQGYVDHISDNGVNNRGLIKSVENLKFLNGRIVVVGTQENVTQILKLFQEFDTPSADLSKPSTTIESYENIGFLNYKLNFHTGSDIQLALKQIGEELQLTKNTKNESLVNAISSLQWIRVTNSLVATGDPTTLQKLKEIIASVDIPLKQVFIEVLVIETDTTNTLDVGLRWGGYSNFKGKFAGVGSNYPRVDSTDGLTFQDTVKGSSTTAGSSSSGVNAVNGPSPNLFNSLSSGQLGIIGDIIFHGGKSYLTLSSLLTALQEEARITTVLNQKIMAQDSRMSQIFVGQNVPFTGSIITTSGISQSTNANLEYRNIGVSLNITPNIGDNGIITLEIDEEITEEANTGTQGDAVNTQAVAGIRTKKSSMQTRVHVPDKAFVVLSGQIRNTQTKAKSGLPCLGGLPVIGAAFTQSSSNDALSDIIIFIRPEIIQTSDQWKEVSEQQEDIVREQGNPEAFDRAVDLVKRD